MKIRVNASRGGDHIHATFFAGESDASLGNLGRLVFRVGEWQLFAVALKAGAKATDGQLTVEISDPLSAAVPR